MFIAPYTDVFFIDFFFLENNLVSIIFLGAFISALLTFGVYFYEFSDYFQWTTDDETEYPRRLLLREYPDNNPEERLEFGFWLAQYHPNSTPVIRYSIEPEDYLEDFWGETSDDLAYLGETLLPITPMEQKLLDYLHDGELWKRNCDLPYEVEEIWENWDWEDTFYEFPIQARHSAAGIHTHMFSGKPLPLTRLTWDCAFIAWDKEDVDIPFSSFSPDRPFWEDEILLQIEAVEFELECIEEVAIDELIDNYVKYDEPLDQYRYRKSIPMWELRFPIEDKTLKKPVGWDGDKIIFPPKPPFDGTPELQEALEHKQTALDALALAGEGDEDIIDKANDQLERAEAIIEEETEKATAALWDPMIEFITYLCIFMVVGAVFRILWEMKDHGIKVTGGEEQYRTGYRAAARDQNYELLRLMEDGYIPYDDTEMLEELLIEESRDYKKQQKHPANPNRPKTWIGGNFGLGIDPDEGKSKYTGEDILPYTKPYVPLISVYVDDPIHPYYDAELIQTEPERLYPNTEVGRLEDYDLRESHEAYDALGLNDDADIDHFEDEMTIRYRD